MKKYLVHVCGAVEDTDTDFKVGFDITVNNGGDVDFVGATIQNALNKFSEKSKKEKSE